MIMPAPEFGRKRVIIDIDTQKHFFSNEGMVRVRNHQEIVANIRRILDWGLQNEISIISTIQIYPRYNGNLWMIDPEGQEKVASTLCSSRTSFPANDHTDLPPQILTEYDQVIFQKRCFDPFEEPRLDRILSELQADEFILIGAVTEGAVRSTANGLLARQKKVTIIYDAIGSYRRKAGELFFGQMLVRDANLTLTNELVGIQQPADTRKLQLIPA